LEKPKENQKKFHKKKTKSTKDPCPVCDKDLYLDSEYTSRVGLLDDDEDVYGWMCPFCMSEFDMEGDVTRLFRDGKIGGNA